MVGCVSWIFFVAPIAILGGPPCHPSYWSCSLSGFPDGQLGHTMGHPDFEKVCRTLSEFAHGHQQHSLHMWLGACCNYTDKLNSETVRLPTSCFTQPQRKKCDSSSDNGLPPIFSFWEVAYIHVYSFEMDGSEHSKFTLKCHPRSSSRGTPDFCTARANPFWLPANT